jgi:hypothetical protein
MIIVEIKKGNKICTYMHVRQCTILLLFLMILSHYMHVFLFINFEFYLYKFKNA